jgi:hypothetical protein
MKRGRFALAAAVLGALVVAGSGSGARATQTIGLKASLDALQQVPRQAVKEPSARGVFTGTLTINASTRRIAWRLTFTRLSGRAIAAHLHLGKYGRSGPIGFTLCRPCRAGVHRTLSVSAKVVAAIKNGAAYVDVHTKKNPRGEIRGQLRLLTGS